MFEVLFMQLTKVNTESCNKCDCSLIFTINNIIEGWPDKFQDIAFKSTKASDILNVMVNIFPFDNS